jgi:hypothetical protein
VDFINDCVRVPGGDSPTGSQTAGVSACSVIAAAVADGAAP